MELQFEFSRQVGTGTNPAAIHFPDNSIMLFWLEQGRLLSGSKIQPASGDVDWGSLNFGEGNIVTGDRDMSFMKLKNIPRLGVYGTWHSGDPQERHRFAIYEDMAELSDYLNDGSIELRLDTPVITMDLTMNNPRQILSGEDRSRLVPGMKVEMFFSSGDSEELPMGVYYIDRVKMGATNATVSVDTRSISGKLLKDQTFDEINTYPKQVYADVVKAVLDHAFVPNYLVQTGGTWELGINFPRNMSILEGLNELIKASRNWVVRETLDGQLVAGSTVTYPPLMPAENRYTFNRGSDVWSRGIVRDDIDIYTKVCVYQSDWRAYTMVHVPNTQYWNYVPNKTLYIEVPVGTDFLEFADLANEVASRLSTAGVIETFVGPFRPQLMPDDEADIISIEGTKLIGIITTVRHTFGKNGFATEFVVDSGGRKGKPMLKDYIESMTRKKGTSEVTRIT